MKKLIPFFVFILSALILACDKPEDPIDEDPISYPITFAFTNLSFGDSHYFVVENQTPIEIDASGNFLLFEEIISQDLTRDYLEFPFEEFVILNESEIRLKTINQGSGVLDTILNYSEFDNTIRVFLNEGNDQYFDLELNVADNELKYCILSSLHSYLDFSNQTDYFQKIEFCIPLELNALALKIMEDNSLQTGDTIAINHSYFVYD